MPDFEFGEFSAEFSLDLFDEGFHVVAVFALDAVKLDEAGICGH